MRFFKNCLFTLVYAALAFPIFVLVWLAEQRLALKMAWIDSFGRAWDIIKQVWSDT